MDRTDIIIKAIAGLVGAIVSIFTGLFGLMFTVLLGMMAIDYITGITSAIVSGEGLSSTRGYRGLFKKVYTMLLIGAILMVEVSILKSNGVITDGVSSAFILIEFVSIIENGNKMGLKLGFLSKLVSTVRGKIPLLDDGEIVKQGKGE
ncbi:phage holin family protein [Cohnella sp. WQ 127256]|uniref:phage holin family protein n=1 Tax=Cohnella sp. WQ 127256 TaxID=2938790 RepID=UPI0021175CDF|nr:phage holin family protein [Cohnella sp. WQ 127256]